MIPQVQTSVVGIGASAGGLDALERFVRAIPLDSGLAYVIIQHLSPDFKSLMDELLGRHTQLPIHRTEDGMEIRPNSIYLIPPKKNIIIEGDKLRLTEQDHSSGVNLPIDVFFRSLAAAQGSRAVAVVLSGTGSDGSQGVRAIHQSGGMVVVQSEETAAFDGMPKASIATGFADLICAPEQMPDRIVSRDNPNLPQEIGYPKSEATDSNYLPPQDLDERARIFSIFRHNYGIDFKHYKPNTIDRRLARRVSLTNCKSIKDYLEKLEDDQAEVEALYRDLLVEVTQFFRDPEAFFILRDRVVPQLIERAKSTGELRIWVPGCATGEEAYSLAMLFRDRLRHESSNIDLKVFATDVHRTSLETASAGVYSANSLASLPAEFRERYLTRIGELYHIAAELRQCVIFAPHDITNDPPFTRIDLISCRNVLIYLEPEVQKRVLSLFHFGLNVGGCVYLGPSESVGELDREFSDVDRTWRIFRKVRNVKLPATGPISPQPALKSVVMVRPSFVATTARMEKAFLVPEIYDHLLAKYAPPCLVVNRYHELVHSFGNARKFLVQPEGRATLDVTRMVTGDLRTALNAALHKSTKSDSGVVLKGVRADSNETETRYNLVVEPYKKGEEELFLISLQQQLKPETVESIDVAEFDSANHSAERIVELERELDYTKETLQATVEELETSNEELQSTNEELVASNEELQSTNEELHSVNEELHTVNAEHQKKISELTQLTNDMDNLLQSTGIGTLFLDESLKIRKFTPDATKVFHVLEQDIGRPISHIAHSLIGFDVVKSSQEVLSQKEILEFRVRNKREQTFFVQLRPYQTADETTPVGVVLTIIDISTIKELEDVEEKPAT